MFGSPSYRLRPEVKVHTHTHTRGGRGGGVEKGELLHIAIPEHSRKAWNIIEMNYSYIDYKLAKKKCLETMQTRIMGTWTWTIRVIANIFPHVNIDRPKANKSKLI